MTRCSGSKSRSREGPGRPPSRSEVTPFVPPSTLSICDRHTRKNDKLSHLPAFRRHLRRKSPPRSDPGARPYNRPHQSRSKRLFKHEVTLGTTLFHSAWRTPEFLDQGKAGSWGRLSKNRLSARKACSAAIAGCDEHGIPVRQAGYPPHPAAGAPKLQIRQYRLPVSMAPGP